MEEQLTDDMRSFPIYMENVRYASQHKELAEYIQSKQANELCKESIEQLIRDHYRNNTLDVTPVEELLDAWGKDRVACLLAYTIKKNSWDKRYCRANREWAAQIRTPKSLASLTTLSSHPGLVDLLTTQVRRIQQYRDRMKGHKQMER